MNDDIDGTILTPYIKGKLKLLPAAGAYLSSSFS